MSSTIESSASQNALQEGSSARLTQALDAPAGRAVVRDSPLPRVIILGGGVAGMSAAHELAKSEAFEVHVFDKGDAFGGKAMSRVPSLPALSGRYAAEHGFRLFPHFYRHLTQTMKEIPFDRRTVLRDGSTESNLIERSPGEAIHVDPKHLVGRRLSNPEGDVWGNLIGSTQAAYARKGEIHVVERPFPYTTFDFIRMVRDMLGQDDVATESDIAAYAWHLLKFMTSCPERREEEYDRLSWIEFLGVGRGIYTPAFEELVRSVPRALQAMRPDIGSARTVGNSTIQLFFDFVNDGGTHMESVLAGPTQETWLNPWKEYLTRLHVKFWPRSTLQKLVFDGLHVVGAEVEIREFPQPRPRDWPPDWKPVAPGSTPGSTVYRVTAHRQAADVGRSYYICALPLEVMKDLFSPEKRDEAKVGPPAKPTGQAATGVPEKPPGDHELMYRFDASIRQLTKIERAVLPMVGIQFFLSRDVPICNGHVFYPDSPWALTSVSQAQFWEKFLPKQLADYLGAKGRGVDRFGGELDPQPQIHGILSVIISDWNTPAPERPEFGPRDPSDKGNRPVAARDMSEAEIKREVWAQLKDALNVPGGRPLLDDYDLWQHLSDHDFQELKKQKTEPGRRDQSDDAVAFLDTVLRDAAVLDQNAIDPRGKLPDHALGNRTLRTPWVPDDRKVTVFAPDDSDGTKSQEPAKSYTPLFVHPKGTYALRPDAELRIPNLLLAADYVRTYTDLATMEGANEAAKRAVLAILRREQRSRDEFPELFPLSEGRLFESAQAVDRLLYNAGKQPHVMDLPQLAALLGGSVAQNALQIGLDLLGVRRKAPPDMARRTAGFPPMSTAAVSTLATGLSAAGPLLYTLHDSVAALVGSVR